MMQTVDLDTARVMAVIPSDDTITITEILERLPGVPVAVLRRRLRRMLRKGLIQTCLCGCRGDTWAVGAADA